MRSSIFALFFIIALNANAQFYIGAEVSGDSLNREDELTDTLTIIQQEFNGAAVFGELEQGTFGGRVFAGYGITENFKLEAGLFGSIALDGKYQILSGSSSGTQLESEISISGFDLSAKILTPRIQILGDEIVFYGQAGLHRSKIDVKVSSSQLNNISISTDSSGTGLLLGAGYELPIEQFGGMRGGYKFYDSIGGENDFNIHKISIGFFVNL